MRGGDSEEDCQGPMYTNSLWMPWPAPTYWPANCTWAQAMPWTTFQVCSALLTWPWTCPMTADSPGSLDSRLDWLVAVTGRLYLSCEGTLLRKPPVSEEKEGGWRTHAQWVRATPALWGPYGLDGLCTSFTHYLVFKAWTMCKWQQERVC